MNTVKYAIVTGSASGIGEATARLLANSEVRVFGLDIEKGTLDNIRSFVCDVSDESQVIAVIEKIKETTRTIDYLVNAAGMLTIGRPIEISQTPVKQLDAIIRINTLSAFILTKHCYPLLKNHGGAAVVNVSSEQAYKPQRGFAPYAISKAAINALTQSAAIEFLDDKIRVNAVAFGTVETNILKSYIAGNEEIDRMFANKQESVPLGVMQPEDAAKVILFLLSDDSRYMTGEVIRVNGGNCLV